jgi:hypothetical protein
VVSAATVVLGVLFPVFGISVLLVLAVEAVVARRNRSRSAAAEPDQDLITGDGDEVPVGALDEALGHMACRLNSRGR